MTKQDARGLFTDTAARSWPGISGMLVGGLITALWPMGNAPLSIVLRLGVIALFAYVFQLVHQGLEHRSREQERRRAAVEREQEQRRDTLERLAELLVSFKPFVTTSRSHAQDASVFLASPSLTDANRATLAIWNQCFLITHGLLYNRHLLLMERLKLDIAEHAYSEARVAMGFGEVSTLVCDYARATKEFLDRCKMEGISLPKTAVDEYKRFRDEYNPWIIQLRAFRDDARRTILPIIDERALELAPEL